jgi:CubicO group peptidase (beta-lactamase class C family)
MKEHVFKPLEITSATFRVAEIPDLGKPFADITIHKPDGSTINQSGTIVTRNPNLDHGGGGLYCSAADYLKILISLLRNDGKLLKSESVEELFTPQLKNNGVLEAGFRREVPGMKFRYLPKDVKVDYGLGGMVVKDPIPGRRGKNSLQWAGRANLCWVRVMELLIIHLQWVASTDTFT